jgi:uncharacterized protein with NRDE domain
MCITFFWIGNKQSPFPFVIAFNRDEVTTRPATQARFLKEEGYQNIICGVDEVTKSTWLAFNKLTGDFACLTNFRNPTNQIVKKTYGSRGFLVTEYVKINDSTIKEKKFTRIEDYEETVKNTKTRGYNLIYGNAFT